MYEIEQLLIALQRSGLLSRAEMVRLQWPIFTNPGSDI
jgi:hypothetical protein